MFQASDNSSRFITQLITIVFDREVGAGINQIEM